MKTIKQFLMLAVMSLVLVNCNSGSSSDLSDTLSGNTFLIEGLEDVMDDVSASCGDSSGTASSDTGTFSLFASATTDAEESSSTSSSDFEISFGASTYTATYNGDEVMDGTWEATDGNTVEIELYGDTYLIDVDVNEDDDTMTVSLNDSQDLECDSSADSDSSVSAETSEPSSSSYLENFSGTWCFLSGAPYYLAIIIDDSQSSAQVAYYVDNADFLNDVSEDMVFSVRSFTVSTTELGQLQTFSTSNVAQIETIADVEFSNDHTQIFVDFGDFTSSYDQSSADGSCPNLTLSQGEINELDDYNL